MILEFQHIGPYRTMSYEELNDGMTCLKCTLKSSHYYEVYIDAFDDMSISIIHSNDAALT